MAHVEDDVNLPRATVNKIIQESLLSGSTCARDCKELIAICCQEFIKRLSAKGNAICEKGKKKTISADHIIEAFEDMGFAEHEDEMRKELEEFRINKEKIKQIRPKNDINADEELEQQRLLDAAKERMEKGELTTPN